MRLLKEKQPSDDVWMLGDKIPKKTYGKAAKSPWKIWEYER
jgi:hypothetical protein